MREGGREEGGRERGREGGKKDEEERCKEQLWSTKELGV